jgi:hypothetical protein
VKAKKNLIADDSPYAVDDDPDPPPADDEEIMNESLPPRKRRAAIVEPGSLFDAGEIEDEEDE